MELMNSLRSRVPNLPGETQNGFGIEYADDFAYTDPVDGSVSKNQGIRIGLAGGSRIIYRLSGTGTVGATLRIYLERFEANPEKQDLETADVMAPLVVLALQIADVEGHTGRIKPDVIT